MQLSVKQEALANCLPFCSLNHAMTYNSHVEYFFRAGAGGGGGGGCVHMVYFYSLCYVCMFFRFIFAVFAFISIGK